MLATVVTPVESPSSCVRVVRSRFDWLAERMAASVATRRRMNPAGSEGCALLRTGYRAVGVVVGRPSGDDVVEEAQAGLAAAVDAVAEAVSGFGDVDMMAEKARALSR